MNLCFFSSSLNKLTRTLIIFTFTFRFFFLIQSLIKILHFFDQFTKKIFFFYEKKEFSKRNDKNPIILMREKNTCYPISYKIFRILILLPSLLIYNITMR